MKKNILVLILVFCANLNTNVFAQQDPFAKYLDSKAPEVIKLINQKDSIGVRIKEVIFRLKDSTEVYAVIASPKSNGKYPGMLVLHGGGGQAEKDKAISWAQRGYVAVAPDLPGVAEPKKLTFTKGRWNKLAYGAERYVANPDVSASVIFDAVLSAMKALYLLRSQPNVNKENIGVVGISWGGYMTTMVCGLAGKKVKAGFSVFGCGFYEQTSQCNALQKMPIAEREQWLQYLDAGKRAKNIKSAFFIAGAANDFFFYPKAVQMTLDSINSDKNHVYAPNVSHKISLPGGSFEDSLNREKFIPTPHQPYPKPNGNKANWLAMEVPFMEYYLKKKGLPFPVVQVSKIKDSKSAEIFIKSPTLITNVVVYWSNQCSEVKTCEWKLLETTQIKQNKYQVELPAEAVQWFVIATDTRPVSVSSDLFLE